ncbi:hypothetical protein NE237_021107 [Protea cynaroides]|uniref:Uncharacterized protein n=1 Tax=Protea cynaroides TaxID=273540 RepID=A0A9Q0HBU6_9MAGN|nr:hypothetical protein NE237_021107 [Protea cynaroides]
MRDSLLNKGSVLGLGKKRYCKRRRWTAAEKGKATLNGSVQANGDWVPLKVAARHESGNGQQRGTVHGSRSFASVFAGLPDLSALPDPVVEGGIIRVVLPQAAVDRQMEKFKTALIGRVFTKDVDEGDEQDLEEGELEDYVKEIPGSVDNQQDATHVGAFGLQGNDGFTIVEKRQSVTTGTEKQQAAVSKARVTRLALLASL